MAGSKSSILGKSPDELFGIFDDDLAEALFLEDCFLLRASPFAMVWPIRRATVVLFERVDRLADLRSIEV